MKDLRQHRFSDEGQPASFAADRLKQRRTLTTSSLNCVQARAYTFFLNLPEALEYCLATSLIEAARREKS